MSLRRKLKTLDDISSIVSRCKNNTAIYESMMKEKERLEREIFISVAGNSKRQTKIYFKDNSEADSHFTHVPGKEKHKNDKTALTSSDQTKSSNCKKTKDLKQQPHCPDYVIKADVQALSKTSNKLPPQDGDDGDNEERDRRKQNNKTEDHNCSKQRRKHKRQSTRDTLRLVSSGQSRSNISVSSRSHTERSKHVKQFTKEEIEQMSSHNKKKQEIRSKSSRNLPVNQSSQLNKDPPKWKQVNSIALNKMNSWEWERDTAQESLASSQVPMATNISSRLMKLREEDGQKEGNRFTPTNPDHALSRRAEKLHPSLESDVRLQDGTKLLKGEVVFKFDLDEIRPKPQDKSLSSIFRRKFFKSKTPTTQSIATQTHKETMSRTNQSYSWTIPGCVYNSSTQTPGSMTTSKSSQTQSNIYCDRSTQTRIKSKTVETQYLADDAQSKDVTTQTEDEDHSVWGGRVSLDRLIQCRAQQRKKNVTFNKNDDNSEGGRCKEEATDSLTREEDQNSARIIPIRSYSWSQTEKFVKIVVSHSGVHLLSAKKICIKTNGLDVRLRITREGKKESSNANNNNNNESAKELQEQFYELNINELCHQVSQMSYSTQPDMMTIVLRKASAVVWHNLTPNDENKHLATTPKVYV